MKQVKRVGIRELKAKLSDYLRVVKAGGRIVITEHDVPIAEVFQTFQGNEHPLVDSWIDEGFLEVPTRTLTPLKRSPISLPDGTAQQFIEEDRGS